jgi:hypothetical protein
VWKRIWLVAAVGVGTLAVTACSADETSPGDAVTIYGDGSIGCPDHRADDRSLPVGTVVYQAGDGEIRVIVTLTSAAPSATYEVFVWGDETCVTGGPFDPDETRGLIETDANGTGGLDFVLTDVQPGTYSLNVNLCCGSDGQQDPRHREMGTAQFSKVVVP